jgi:hypothetical protein
MAAGTHCKLWTTLLAAGMTLSGDPDLGAPISAQQH